jgi:hypothetical protein
VECVVGHVSGGVVTVSNQLVVYRVDGSRKG